MLKNIYSSNRGFYLINKVIRRMPKKGLIAHLKKAKKKKLNLLAVKNGRAGLAKHRLGVKFMGFEEAPNSRTGGLHQVRVLVNWLTFRCGSL